MARSEISMTFGVHKWVPAAVFVGWLVYYSLPFRGWQNAFAEWFGGIVAKHGTWVR